MILCPDCDEPTLEWELVNDKIVCMNPNCGRRFAVTPLYHRREADSIIEFIKRGESGPAKTM